MASTLRGAALVAALLSAPATAHEHHLDNIKAGFVVSEDPIVRHNRTWGPMTLLADDSHRTLFCGYIF